jgi:hypothetical protein
MSVVNIETDAANTMQGHIKACSNGPNIVGITPSNNVQCFYTAYFTN